MKKQCILIADDNNINRVILCDMLEDKYDIVEATNGAEAISVLETNNNISMLLLDVVMPEKDGFDVLHEMNKQGWINDIPVIMISAETSTPFIRRAYELGAEDYINRPFDPQVVAKRIQNALMLQAKQKRLMEELDEQLLERERQSNMMITILSHIVEYRNGESGTHVLHINTITGLLLEALLQHTDKYNISQKDISVIRSASSFHDIGKLGIPLEILNKPGRLTPEEFEIMKTHSAIGDEMLSNMSIFQEEPLVKTAKEICRWHHERWDGNGYPDGLKGDEIPISAQVVSLADVYDALTSVRCYKKAFSHETAMSMIMEGQCGTFNPILLKCLKSIEEQLQYHLDAETNDSPYNTTNDIVPHRILSTLHSEKGGKNQ